MDRTEYLKDRDSIMTELQDMEAALGNLEVYCKNDYHSLAIAEFLKRRCEAIKAVFGLRELEMDREVEDMAKAAGQ